MRLTTGHRAGESSFRGQHLRLKIELIDRGSLALARLPTRWIGFDFEARDLAGDFVPNRRFERRLPGNQ